LQNPVVLKIPINPNAKSLMEELLIALLAQLAANALEAKSA